jgi:hypothetical protein
VVAGVDARNRLIRESNCLVPTSVEVRPVRGVRAYRPQISTETVALRNIGELSIRMPRLYKPAEEMELRRKIRVAGREHVDRSRGLRHVDSGFDLVESAWITEAATRTADDDVQTGTLVFHPQFLDQRQRLGTDLNRFSESSGQHLVAAVLRERLRTRAGRGAIGDRFEGAADVVVGRCVIVLHSRA